MKEPRTIAELQNTVHDLAREKGWWDGIDIHQPAEVLSKLALIHSEISEATEAVRDGHIAVYFGEHGKPEGMAVELADAVIRILDLAQAMNISLESAIRIKHDFNTKRPHRHGGKRA